MDRCYQRLQDFELPMAFRRGGRSIKFLIAQHQILILNSLSYFPAS